MENIKNLKTVIEKKVGLIVAAGMSRRLKEIGNHEVKEMIVSKNKPIIDNSINSLLQAKVSKIIIVIRTGKESLIEYIKRKYSHENIHFIYQEGEIGNLIDAIKTSYLHVRGYNVLFRMADTFIEPNPFVQKNIQNKTSLNLFCFYEDNEAHNYGSIDINTHQVVDKSKKFVSNICWGALSWDKNFTEKLIGYEELTQVINSVSFNYEINIQSFIDIGNELAKNTINHKAIF